MQAGKIVPVPLAGLSEGFSPAILIIQQTTGAVDARPDGRAAPAPPPFAPVGKYIDPMVTNEAAVHALPFPPMLSA